MCLNVFLNMVDYDKLAEDNLAFHWLLRLLFEDKPSSKLRRVDKWQNMVHETLKSLPLLTCFTI